MSADVVFTSDAGLALAAQSVGGSASIWGLFRASFDVFTVLLLLGSFVAVTIIVRAVLDLRESRVNPPASEQRLRELLEAGRLGEARAFADEDGAVVSRVLAAAMRESGLGRDAAREAAELQAGLEVSRLLSRIEPLNVIGNLGPLVGLAGTVWGMILAFVTLNETAGQAGPAALSLGIAKALFHTLLGLLLAIPCLLVFGLYRGRVDRLATRSTADAARLLERLHTAEAAAEAASEHGARLDRPGWPDVGFGEQPQGGPA